MTTIVDVRFFDGHFKEVKLTSAVVIDGKGFYDVPKGTVYFQVESH